MYLTDPKKMERDILTSETIKEVEWGHVLWLLKKVVVTDITVNQMLPFHFQAEI